MRVSRFLSQSWSRDVRARPMFERVYVLKAIDGIVNPSIAANWPNQFSRDRLVGGAENSGEKEMSINHKERTKRSGNARTDQQHLVVDDNRH